MIMLLLIVVALGFCAAVIAWWLLRPHGGTGPADDE
jgi:hypothetical protein